MSQFCGKSIHCDKTHAWLLAWFAVNRGFQRACADCCGRSLASCCARITAGAAKLISPRAGAVRPLVVSQANQRSHNPLPTTHRPLRTIRSNRRAVSTTISGHTITLAERGRSEKKCAEHQRWLLYGRSLSAAITHSRGCTEPMDELVTTVSHRSGRTKPVETPRCVTLGHPRCRPLSCRGDVHRGQFRGSAKPASNDVAEVG